MSEVYFRIEGGDVLDAPVIIVQGGVMTAISSTAYLRRVLPLEHGFEFGDFVRTAGLIGCTPLSLCSFLLMHPGRGGVTHAIMVRLMADVLFEAERPPLLTPAAAADECPICLSDDAGPWATAAGCGLHRFHSACICRWTRGTCPVCRQTFQDVLGRLHILPAFPAYHPHRKSVGVCHRCTWAMHGFYTGNSSCLFLQR
jgi:hypothetical protein